MHKSNNEVDVDQSTEDESRLVLWLGKSHTL